MVKLTPEELQKGDILLCRGKDWISKLIIWLGGGLYSHATIYVGMRTDKDGNVEGNIAEADFEGISYMTLEKIRRDEKYADVYRFKKDGNTLGDADWPPDPILKVADYYIQGEYRYAFNHLLLLALLAFTYKVNPILKWLLRPLLDRATDFLFKLKHENHRPMVCSEFTYRCFAEAKPERKYVLELTKGLLSAEPVAFQPAPLKSASAASPEPVSKFEESRRRFSEAWAEASHEPTIQPLLVGAGALNIETAAPSSVGASWIQPVPSCVTPYDLQTSPDLVRIGRLVLK